MSAVDSVWKCSDPIQPSGKSNFSKLSKSVGGVGANLARAVARSDSRRRTTFVTAVANDSDGEMVKLELSKELGEDEHNYCFSFNNLNKLVFLEF